MKNKSWLENISSICTIPGISVVSVIIFIITYILPPSNTEQQSSTELITKYEIVAITTTESTETEITEEKITEPEIKTQQQSEAIVVKSEAVSDEKTPKKIEEENECIDSISAIESKDDSDNRVSENHENNELIKDVEHDDSNTAQKSYTINIDAPGKLFFISNDDIGQNGSVDILYNSELDSLDEQDTQSHNLLDIVNVNTENFDDDQQVKYISVVPGVYVFNFIDCNFENINLYLDDDTDQVTDELYDEIDGNIDIPSQNVVRVQMSQDNFIYRIKALSQDNFTPIIKFYSENNIGGTLTILDEFGNKLQSVELYEEDDNSTQNIEGSFDFEIEKEYYIEITSSQNEDLSEYIYYLQIIDPNIYNEDDEI